MMRPLDREIRLRMIGALLMGVLALIVILVAAMALSGCSQMPVTRGQYQADKADQAKKDADQSNKIAKLYELEEGMGGVVERMAPEVHRPAAAAIKSKVTAVRPAAEAMAAKHAEDAQQEARKLEDLNSSPGAGAWLQAGLGALSGNFSGLLELLLGALGAGGAFQALRYRSRAQRMAEKAETYAEMDPEVARKVVEVDEDLAKHRRKRKS